MLMEKMVVFNGILMIKKEKENCWKDFFECVRLNRIWCLYGGMVLVRDIGSLFWVMGIC